MKIMQSEHQYERKLAGVSILSSLDLMHVIFFIHETIEFLLLLVHLFIVNTEMGTHKLEACILWICSATPNFCYSCGIILMLKFLQMCSHLGLNSGSVVNILTSQRKGHGLNSSLVLSVWSLHLLLVHVWVFSKHSRFLLNSKNRGWLIGNSELPKSANKTESSLVSLIGLA